MISRNTENSYRNKNNNQSKCYRPLQQLYKIVYSPIYGRIDFACIDRPSERYKTTNMTYGSFHYDNWTFIQKNRRVNCDKKMNSKKDRAFDSNENRLYTSSPKRKNRDHQYKHPNF
jgi:hypothetical protein